MKAKIKDYIVNLLIIILLILVFINKNLISFIIYQNSILYFKIILPSLLPIIIISKLLVNNQAFKIIPEKLNQLVNKILKLDGPTIFIYFLSFISGIPSFSILTNELIKNNFISNKTYQKLNYFLYLHNPLFLYYNLTIIFNNHITIILIIILTPYLMGIIYPLFSQKENFSNDKNIKLTSHENIFLETGKTLLSIYITILFFGIISSLITIFLKNNNIIKCIIFGTLEMTNGLNLLGFSNYSIIIKIILASYFINFGGLSIIFQMKNVIKNDISYQIFFKYRLLSFLITIIICLIAKIISIW